MLHATVSLALVLAAVNVAEPEAPQPIEAKVEDLAFIAGSWGGAALGGYSEEHWSVPKGDSMMAMFRLINGKGKTVVYEMLLIEQADKHVTLSFRHFGYGNKPWEPNDKPLTFHLIKKTENQAVFHNLGEQVKPKRMTYTRQGDVLDVHVQNVVDGKLDAGFHVRMPQTRLPS